MPPISKSRQEIALLVCAVALLVYVVLRVQPKPQLQPQRLRIRNGGTMALKKLVIGFPEERIRFGDVVGGAITSYQPVSHGVYGYGSLYAQVNGKMVELRAIDFEGETPLKGKAFTYTIKAIPPSSATPSEVSLRLVGANVDS